MTVENNNGSVTGVIAVNHLGDGFWQDVQFCRDRKVLVPDVSDLGPDDEYHEVIRESLRWDDLEVILNNDVGTLQVVKSPHTRECRWCSPCYPGQGDLASKVEPGFGACDAYDVPPEWRNQ